MKMKNTTKKVATRPLIATKEIKAAKEKGRQQGMTQGIAYCVAIMLSVWGEHPWIDEVWGAAGMSLEECKELDVAEYDMDILNQHKEYLEKLSNK